MVGDPGAGARQKFPVAGELASVAWIDSLAAMTRCLIVLLVLALAGLATAGSPAEAEQVRGEYRAEMQAWMKRLEAAASVEQQRKVWQVRPAPAEYAKKMRRCIANQLDEAWTLKYAAWLLKMCTALKGSELAQAGPDVDGTVAGGNEWVPVISGIREAVEKHHLQSADPGLVEMCMALVDVPDPRSLAILEKIEQEHPSKKVQGVAALGVSMLLKTLGEEGEVMRRRLGMLRKAIIGSAEIEIGGQTVAKIAEDELYLINHLTKGRVAPEMSGQDVAGRAMKLSSYRGKVVVLLFWSTRTGDVERLLGMGDQLAKEHSGKPFAVLGVNPDPTATLRQLVREGVVSWPNFSDPDGKIGRDYRVAAWPLAIVLDKEGVIRYIGSPGSFVDLTVDAILGGK